MNELIVLDDLRSSGYAESRTSSSFGIIDKTLFIHEKKRKKQTSAHTYGFLRNFTWFVDTLSAFFPTTDHLGLLLRRFGAGSRATDGNSEI